MIRRLLVRTSNYAFLTLWASVLLFACGVLSAASGQTISGSSTNSAPPQQQQKPARPTVVLPEEQSARPVAGDTELYCAGFIQSEPVVIDLEIVGGEKEESSRVFSTGDYLFINAGAQQGMRVGQSFSIVRPRTPFDSKFTQKKGGLGVRSDESFRRAIPSSSARARSRVCAWASRSPSYARALLSIPSSRRRRAGSASSYRSWGSCAGRQSKTASPSLRWR